jgi:hypothetical protein
LWLTIEDWIIILYDDKDKCHSFPEITELFKEEVAKVGYKWPNIIIQEISRKTEAFLYYVNKNKSININMHK